MREGEIDSHIHVERVNQARDTEFIIKQITLENKNHTITTPYKILDGKGISSSIYPETISSIPQPFYENGRFIGGYRSFHSLFNLLEESGSKRVQGLDQFFSLKKSVWNNSLSTISAVFQRNPFIDYHYTNDKGQIKSLLALQEESFEWLLDYIYAASSAMILVPDIRFDKNSGISIPDYLQYIDSSVKILSDWNKKPIFVPIQLDFSRSNLQNILSHYRLQGYSNFWVNFNARSCDNTYSSRLRSLHRNLKKWMAGVDYTLYYSHIKKEITPHISDGKVPASDILTQFFGGDFIGINREPYRVVPPQEGKTSDQIDIELAEKYKYSSPMEYKRANFLHKNRIFDPNSYYYYTIPSYPNSLLVGQKDLISESNTCSMINNALKYGEIEKTKEYIMENPSVQDYLKNKTAFIDNNALLQSVISGPPDRQFDILSFLAGLDLNNGSDMDP